MASLIYNRFFYNLANKKISWTTDTIKCALLSSGYTPDKDHAVWSTSAATLPKAYETTSTQGYSAGGETISGSSLTQDDTNNWAKLNASDVSWTTSTITARYAVLWDDSSTDDGLIAVFQFTENKSSSNGTFTVQWASTGIITLAGT
jgi:hypothetical protein